MPRKLRAGQERKISVSISIDPQKWAELEKRCNEIQIWLRQIGVTEKDASAFSRSALIRQTIELMSTPSYVSVIKGQIGLMYGVDFDQMEIPFPKD